jgi:hypothetical protein
MNLAGTEHGSRGDESWQRSRQVRSAFGLWGLPVALVAHPLAPLVALALATSVALCGFSAAGAAPSPGAELVLSYGWALMLLLWMDADARRLRRLPCYDFGLLAAVFFPLSLAWYCLWSRGWRGLLVLLALLALWLLPYVAAAAFGIVMSV